MFRSDNIKPRTTAGARPTIALVGNAPLQYDQSQQIDSCDIVVRCNEAKNLGRNSGTRTDMLCVNNCGVPGLRYIEKKSLRFPRFPHLKELWFARHGKENHELSLKILEANHLEIKETTYFSETMTRMADDFLRQYVADTGSMNSTGFLALWHILERPDFAHYDKFIFGFTFHVWEGHPAYAERRAIEDLCRSRNDLFFVPAARFWKSRSILKDTRLYQSGRKIVLWMLHTGGRFLRFIKVMD